MPHTVDLNNVKIAYIGGGSKNWAPELMSDLVLQGEFRGEVRLYDIDRSAAARNRELGNMISRRPDVMSAWRYEVSITMKDALADADFVVISIMPGTFEEMRSDVHAPEKYGIYQAVGDTVGPAGILRSLRTIPMYRYFAEQIRDYAPDAWVINYTNPMSICMRTLYEVFPGIKAIGCCHNVFEAQRLLACSMQEICGIKNVVRQEIKVNVLGINHFTWFDHASYQNIDILKVFGEFAAKFADSGYDTNGERAWETNVYDCANRVGFDLFKRYGIIPASSDRHISEFFPPFYLKDPETVRAWKFSLTPVSQRISEDKAMEKYREDVLTGRREFKLAASGEEGIQQMSALLGLGNLATNVNLPNVGQMPGLPMGCIVETNAMLARDSVKPLFAGKLPDDLHTLVVRHVFNQEMVLKAGLNCDKELAFRAFANDPLVTTPYDVSRRLFEEMLQNTAEYLPGWELGKASA